MSLSKREYIFQIIDHFAKTSNSVKLYFHAKIFFATAESSKFQFLSPQLINFVIIYN